MEKLKDKKYIALHQTVIDEGIIIFRLPDCAQIITEGNPEFKNIIPDFIIRDEEMSNVLFEALDLMHSIKMGWWMNSDEYKKQYNEFIEEKREFPPVSVEEHFR